MSDSHSDVVSNLKNLSKVLEEVVPDETKPCGLQTAVHRSIPNDFEGLLRIYKKMKRLYKNTKNFSISLQWCTPIGASPQNNAIKTRIFDTLYQIAKKFEGDVDEVHHEELEELRKFHHQIMSETDQGLPDTKKGGSCSRTAGQHADNDEQSKEDKDKTANADDAHSKDEDF